MKTVEFDYNLPPELIAQKSAEPRDSSRLLVLDRKSGNITHTKFRSIVEYLKPGDVLVFNDSKVFRARLRGRNDYGRDVEIFLLRVVRDAAQSTWEALLKPGRMCKIGDRVQLTKTLSCEVLAKAEDGVVELVFSGAANDVFAYCDMHGEIPVPPYVTTVPEHTADYQTVYARETGSVAAPTAGFHFTNELLEQIRSMGVQTAFVTLHVGIGTFRPVQTDTLEEHVMHEEWLTVPKETQEAVARAKQDGRRVIAVGTTSMRALESGITSGTTNLFITPGYAFKTVAAMITNFHVPKSTLLVLVSAFAGKEHIFRAYEDAIKEKYRFLSFGDAMFLK